METVLPLNETPCAFASLQANAAPSVAEPATKAAKANLNLLFMENLPIACRAVSRRRRMFFLFRRTNCVRPSPIVKEISGLGNLGVQCPDSIEPPWECCGGEDGAAQGPSTASRGRGMRRVGEANAKPTNGSGRGTSLKCRSTGSAPFGTRWPKSPQTISTCSASSGGETWTLLVVMQTMEKNPAVTIMLTRCSCPNRRSAAS